jgi:hypothetical protein
MTEAMIQHEHKEFIDTIMYNVKAYSRLMSMGDWHGDLRKEADTLIEDIENSLYRRLDEVGDSE